MVHQGCQPNRRPRKVVSFTGCLTEIAAVTTNVRLLTGVIAISSRPLELCVCAWLPGRQSPGWCYRLYSETTYGAMEESAQPEIATADLSSLALQLAQWGCGDVLLMTARFSENMPALARCFSTEQRGAMAMP